MDVEIKEFSLTILVGVAFVVSLILSIRLTIAPTFKIHLPHLFRIGADGEQANKAEEILTFAHNIALVVVFLGLGLLIQDSSKSVVAQRSWPIPYSFAIGDWFVQKALPPAEMTSRLEPFFVERAVDEHGKTWSPQREVASLCDEFFRSRIEASNTSVPMKMQLNAFAQQIIPQLVPDPQRPVLADIAPANDVLHNLLRYTMGDKTAKVPKCKELLNVDLLYYRAKNRAFQNKEYFEELREIEGKLNFLRGMIFVIAITWLMYVGLMVVRGICWIWRQVCSRDPAPEGAKTAGATSTASPPGNSKPNKSLLSSLRAVPRHAAWLAILFVGGYFLQDAYRAEQLNFNNRVYGYFEVLCLIGKDCLKEAGDE